MIWTGALFRRSFCALALVAGVTLAGMSAASAVPTVTLGFDNITGNNAVDAANGEGQLFVDVVDLDPTGQVRFDFRNVGPEAMSITDVYFDDGSLLGIASLVDSDEGTGGDPNVDFSEGASPPDLPGGNDPSVNFNTTAGFLADSDNPPPQNGVEPGQSLGVIFDLQSGQGFQDVLDALELARNNPGVDVVGGLRIGIHVQGFDGGGSESFVNNGVSVPAPTTLLLLGTALIGLGGLQWRRARRVPA